MSKKNHEIKVSEEVLEVLRKSGVNPNGVILPPALDRDLYNRIAKPLGALGISWSRKDGCHIFAEGAYEKLQVILGGGSVIDTTKSLQQYFTPPEVAKFAATQLTDSGDTLSGAEVLEPSAGHGALALAALELGGDPTCVETDPECVKKLQEGGFDTYSADFLALPCDFFKQKFDFVLMNPPFSTGQDAKHVIHALNFLKRGGVLVSIMAPSYKFRTDAIYAQFRAIFEMHDGKIMEELPAGTFRESGTDIATTLIKIQK